MTKFHVKVTIGQSDAFRVVFNDVDMSSKVDIATLHRFSPKPFRIYPDCRKIPNGRHFLYCAQTHTQTKCVQVPLPLPLLWHNVRLLACVRIRVRVRSYVVVMWSYFCGHVCGPVSLHICAHCDCFSINLCLETNQGITWKLFERFWIQSKTKISFRISI